MKLSMLALYLIYTTNSRCSDIHQTLSLSFIFLLKLKAHNLLQVYTFSNKGHKAPSIADTAAGRYAGSLFTAASKN
jgi:hypothetical protein